MYSKPIITINAIVKALEFNYSIANRIVNDLVDKKVVRMLNVQGKEKLYLFEEYLDIFLKEKQIGVELLGLN